MDESIRERRGTKAEVNLAVGGNPGKQGRVCVQAEEGKGMTGLCRLILPTPLWVKTFSL